MNYVLVMYISDEKPLANLCSFKGRMHLLPNFHQVDHIRLNAEHFGTNLNVTTTIGELIHMLWKNLVPHTNYREMDKAFFRYVIALCSLLQHRRLNHLFKSLILYRYWTLMDTLRSMMNMENSIVHLWVPILKELSSELPCLMANGYFFGRSVKVS